MSDGNFNRSLLPHTPFHSGLTTGRQQMKKMAMDTLNALLEDENCTLSPEEKKFWLETFNNKLQIKG